MGPQQLDGSLHGSTVAPTISNAASVLPQPPAAPTAASLPLARTPRARPASEHAGDPAHSSSPSSSTAAACTATVSSSRWPSFVILRPP
ncbi:unnamed protein product, partial [Prorocentrum cordatum]